VDSIWEHNHHERGSGTVLAIGIIAVIVLVASFLVALGSAQQARWQAQTAADMGALAAATARRTGRNVCELGALAVAMNGGQLTICELLPAGAVKLGVRVNLQLIGNHSIYAKARASPAN
jgi:secretion/DNA translocation related TadE-like protein